MQLTRASTADHRGVTESVVRVRVLRVRLVLVAVNAIGAHADEAIAHCGVLRAVTSGGAVGVGELPLLWPRVLALSGPLPASPPRLVSLD